MNATQATKLVLLLLSAALWANPQSLAQSLASPMEDLSRVNQATSRRIASNAAAPESNADNRWVKPGATFELANIKGPGVIRHIWLTFAEAAPSWLSKDGAADPSEIVLRMYWDGATEPAVEAPLGDFFAAGFGKRAEINSAPVQVQGGDAYNCYWPMPFHSLARITVTNESTRVLGALYYQVDFTQEPVADDQGFFCAQYRQEFPTQLGRDYLIADIDAPRGGHYVGTVLSVRSRSPQWFGEGDEKFYVDGETSPSLWGTGTEDYFSNAWGVEKACFPYFGVTILDGSLADVGDKGTMYRWHIQDPVRFRKSLRFAIEHAGWMSADETSTGKVEGFVEREDDFASVAFWYQIGQPKRFAPIPSASERRWPRIDDIIDGATLVEHAVADGGSLSIQAGGLWTGSGQLFFDNERGIGGSFQCVFQVPSAGNYRLVVPITHSYDFGVYSLTLDGRAVGEPIDCFDPKVQVFEHALGDMKLDAGPHTLVFKCVGRSDASKAAKLGVDSVRIRHRWDSKRAPLKPH